jgi:ADP-heptose:LPS heptosyltransferase/tetratricopeptide (TPR) repeat protein
VASVAVPATASEIGQDMVRRADAARDAKQFQPAAFLYSEAVRWLSGDPGLHIQAGHMFKECGDLASAERHYRTALQSMPDDADLALQLGHFFKSCGRLSEASDSYRRALALQPHWDTPKHELQGLHRAGWREPGKAIDKTDSSGALTSGAETMGADVRAPRLAPELAPRPMPETYHAHAECIELRRLGRRERTNWGTMPTLRGIEAFRGFCISSTPILTVALTLNGQLVYRGGVKGGYEIAHERENTSLRKYVFNVWMDLSNFVEGRYEIEYRFTDINHRTLTRVEPIVIAAPLVASALPDSDGIVPPPDPLEDRSLEDLINGRPSMVRPGRRALVDRPPRQVLVLRTDQLGDLAISAPALRRLREILPQARIVGLVAEANREFAATLGLFDEILSVEFRDDPWERRRVMPIEHQQALAARLAPYEFDMAIDCSENEWSRLLLPLSGAPILVGFPSGRLPELTIEGGGNTHDRWNGHEIVPHTNKLLALVEWLGAMLRSEPNVLKREDLDAERLAPFGIGRDSRYAVLHDGARLQFSRWPYYFDLAQMIIDGADLNVVMLTDDQGAASRLPDSLSASDRFRLIDQRLPFDELDTLFSFCKVFVGNDSGPKHLASLRGAKVVSIHMARNNWNEWGQESGGYIFSRKLPCAGCLIHHDPEECGKDFVCIRGIRPQEVFAAVKRLVDEG